MPDEGQSLDGAGRPRLFEFQAPPGNADRISQSRNGSSSRHDHVAERRIGCGIHPPLHTNRRSLAAFLVEIRDARRQSLLGSREKLFLVLPTERRLAGDRILPAPEVDEPGLRQDGRLEGTRKAEFARVRRLLPEAPLEELAKKAGFDSGFTKQVADYNKAVETKKDPFGKPAEFLQFGVKEGPFYAFRAKVVSLSTLGGLRVNENMQVLDGDYRTIGGLYATGNNAYGFYSTPSYPPYQGLALGFAYNSGRIAGMEAAKAVKAAK